MSLQSTVYCLDANVLIKAWESYYAPKFCPSYWTVLDELGAQGQVFVPSWVAEEIHRTDDDLSRWLKKSRIKVRSVTEEVGLKLKEIYAKDPRHQLLVDNTKQRSLADPWLSRMPWLRVPASCPRRKSQQQRTTSGLRSHTSATQWVFVASTTFR